jgi:hypothetical protein
MWTTIAASQKASCARILKHRRKEHPRFVTAQTEPFPHGLLENRSNRASSLSTAISPAGGCETRVEPREAIRGFNPETDVRKAPITCSYGRTIFRCGILAGRFWLLPRMVLIRWRPQGLGLSRG